MEDGAALGLVMQGVTDRGQIAAQLAVYNKIRHSRASSIQLLSSSGMDQKPHEDVKQYMEGNPIPSICLEIHCAKSPSGANIISRNAPRKHGMGCLSRCCKKVRGGDEGSLMRHTLPDTDLRPVFYIRFQRLWQTRGERCYGAFTHCFLYISLVKKNRNSCFCKVVPGNLCVSTYLSRV